MYYDFHRTSVGQYVIFATVTGSFSERVYTQVGRRYKDLASAARAGAKLAANGGQDVTLKDLVNRKVFYFDSGKAKEERDDH